MDYGPLDTLAQRAKAARRFRKLTQVQVAQRAAVNQSDISKIERGETLRPAGLLQIARAYECDPHWLDTGDGTPPWDQDHSGPQPGSYRRLGDANVLPGPAVRGQGRYPLISFVQAGEWTAIHDNFQPGDAEEWPVTHLNLGRNGYVLRVNGDSMTAPGERWSFPHGMLLFVNPDKEPMPGQFVIVRRERDKEATFKKLIKVDGELFLEAINPAWPKRYIQLEPGDVWCGVVVDASFGNLP